MEQSRELCGIGHDRGFGLGDLRFNFHAVSIAERVGHPLSYPKDFSNYFRQSGGDATDPPHFSKFSTTLAREIGGRGFSSISPNYNISL